MTTQEGKRGESGAAALTCRPSSLGRVGANRGRWPRWQHWLCLSHVTAGFLFILF